MAVMLLGTPGLPWTDSNGDPLNGGLINAYEPGTTTRRNTYPTRSDADAGTNANANPVVLSSTGIAEIWLDARYKIIVTDSGGTTIDTIDEVGDLTGADVFDRDHIAGMLVSIDADADHDINITSGECRDSADSFDISRSAEYTKKIDAAWAAGDDAGGLAEHAVAVVANNTIYYIWAIAKSGDNTSDFLISTSSSSPTLPTDYDKKRLIGVTKTDGSANLERVSNIERTGFSAVWPDSGAADAYVITPIPALTAYASGARFSFIAENACTGATTINVSALGTKAIQLRGSALTGVEIGAAKLATVEYSAGAFQIVSGATPAAASATVAGVVELATDAEVTTGSDTARAVTPAGLHQKTTSATAVGLVELATDAEVTTGSDTARAVTPAGLHQKTSSATAVGLVELATDAEVTTGSDTARAVTAAGLHQKTSSATAIGLVELATDAEVTTGSDTARAVTPAGLHQKTATTSAVGLVELATTAETQTGTDTSRAVTSDGLHDMTTLSGAAWMKDEDDMATNSATVVASQQSIKAYVDASAGVAHNHLINGEFSVSQRATSFVAGANNDDVYTLDRWNLVSDGNDIVDVTQSTTVPTGGALKSIALDVETANKQFGIVQIIEAANCTGLIGSEVTFSFKAKVSNVRLGDVRAGIIAWSSTSDSVTSDVVATYNDDANPTLASDLTFENTPSDLNLTTSWVTYSVTGTIDTGSTTNVIVWIGSVDSTTTAGDFLYITDCQLEVGATATDFAREDIGTTLGKCYRYLYEPTGVSIANQRVADWQGPANSTTLVYLKAEWRVPMRVTPALTATAGDWVTSDDSAGTTVTALSLVVATDMNALISVTVGSGLTQFRTYNLEDDGTGGRIFLLSAEL